MKNLSFAKEVDLSSPRLRPWLNQLSTIAGDAATTDLIRSNGLIGREYERLLISLLLAGQSHRDDREHTATIAPACVRRAEDFIRARATEPITLEDVACAAEAPVRSLLDSFRRFRGTSPIRYLKDVRLDLARDKLLVDDGATAANVAFEAGFNHLGRFAGDYFKRFGEKPSETLRKKKQVQ